jgi:hypothetical protein
VRHNFAPVAQIITAPRVHHHCSHREHHNFAPVAQIITAPKVHHNLIIHNSHRDFNTLNENIYDFISHFTKVY